MNALGCRSLGLQLKIEAQLFAFAGTMSCMYLRWCCEVVILALRDEGDPWLLEDEPLGMRRSSSEEDRAGS